MKFTMPSPFVILMTIILVIIAALVIGFVNHPYATVAAFCVVQGAGMLWAHHSMRGADLHGWDRFIMTLLWPGPVIASWGGNVQ